MVRFFRKLFLKPLFLRLTSWHLGLMPKLQSLSPGTQPRPQGFSFKKWVGREKALASAGHVYSLNIPEKLIYMQPAGFALTEGSNNGKYWHRELCQYFRVCAIQKLKIHLIAHYSNARSLWKGRPALRCHVQNMSNASALRQAVMSHCYRLVLRLNFIVTVELLNDQAGSDFVQCQTKMQAFICLEDLQWIWTNWT